MIAFTVPGEPTAKGRPRFVRATGRTYTPEKTRNAEAFIKSCAMDAMNGAPPITGPCKLSVLAVFQIPASWSKRKKAGAVHVTKKPDADNLMKVTDALNGIVWLDDSQVVDARICKAYGEPPRMEFQVVPLDVAEYGRRMLNATGAQ